MRIFLLCCWLLAAPLIATDDPATALIFRAHPSLAEGGESPREFAVWANTRYLLEGAHYVGEVAAFGPRAQAHLFISGRAPVLAAWSMSEPPPTVALRLGRRAKCFAWGEETTALRGSVARLTLTQLPLFVRDVEAAYVAEAAANALRWHFTTPLGTNPARQEALLAQLGSAAPAPLDAEVEAVLGVEARERLHAACRATTAALDARASARALKALDALGREVEAALDAALAKRAQETAGRRFALARRLLDFRLRLCEVRVALGAWRGERAADPLSPTQRIGLSRVLLPLHVQAEPEGCLRGYPHAARFAALALDDLRRAASGPSSREQARLVVLTRYVPPLLAREAPSAWNLEITARIDAADGGEELVLRLHNRSTEEARGTLRLALDERQMSGSFNIAPGGAGELGFPLARRPGALLLARVTGALDDGTPLPTHTLPLYLPPAEDISPTK